MKAIVGFLALTIVGAIPAGAAPLAPTKPSQLGTLFSASGFLNGCGTGSSFGELAFQMLPDSTGTAFNVPPGEVFLLQRLDVSLSSSGSATSFVVYTTNLSTSSSSYVSEQAVTVSGATTIHLDYPNGLVVKPGTRVCLYSANASVSVGNAYGYGYFTKDK